MAIDKSANCQGLNINNIYNFRGQAYFKLKNFEKADKDFNEAIHLSDEKSKIPFINSLGRCRIEMSNGDPILIE